MDQLDKLEPPGPPFDFEEARNAALCCLKSVQPFKSNLQIQWVRSGFHRSVLEADGVKLVRCSGDGVKLADRYGNELGDDHVKRLDEFQTAAAAMFSELAGIHRRAYLALSPYLLDALAVASAIMNNNCRIRVGRRTYVTYHEAAMGLVLEILLAPLLKEDFDGTFVEGGYPSDEELRRIAGSRVTKVWDYWQSVIDRVIELPVGDLRSLETEVKREYANAMAEAQRARVVGRFPSGLNGLDGEGRFVEYSPQELVRLFKAAGQPLCWDTLRKRLEEQVYPNAKIHDKLYRFRVGVLPDARGTTAHGDARYVEYSPRELVILFDRAGHPASWGTIKKRLAEQVYPNEKIHDKLYRFPNGVLPRPPA